MHVNKIDFSRITQAQTPFTTIFNKVLQNIPDAFALGVFCYMASLPPSWNFNKTQLCRHFGVGRDKMDKALSYLTTSHLIHRVAIRSKNGQIENWEIEVQDGQEFIEKIVNNQESYTTTLKTRIVDLSTGTTTLKIHPVDNPPTGETPTIEEINKSFKKENKKIEREPLSKIESKSEKPKAEPTHFEPSEENVILCLDLKLSMPDELSSFINRHKGEKSQYEFQRWLKNSHQYQSRKMGGASGANGANPVQPVTPLRSTVCNYDIKPAQESVVNEHMAKIRQLLQGKLSYVSRMQERGAMGSA